MKRKLTHYEVLGVAPGLPLETIHDAYLQLAWVLHPDRNKDEDASSKMAAVTEAWSVIKDRDQRKAYDARLRLEGALCKECGGVGSFTGLRGFGGSATVVKVCGKCQGKGLKNA